jgi:hypothetical protein
LNARSLFLDEFTEFRRDAVEMKEPQRRVLSRMYIVKYIDLLEPNAHHWWVVERPG